MGNPKSVDRSGWSGRYQLRVGTAQILIHLSHAMTVGVSSADPVSVSLVDPADIVTPNPSNLVSWLYTPAWTHFICLPKVCRFEAQAPHALLLQCCMLPSNFCALAGLNLHPRPIQISLNLPWNLWLWSHENAHNSRATWVCKCSIFSPLWQPVPWSLLQINYYIFCWLFFGFVSLWASQWTWSQLERFILPSMKWPLVG